ncbi:hypothetical protein CDD81_3134 [Ophiocordyceps australis]|uniref:Phosphoglycerate mutase family protein n=1 Tax=Ophiocordyceps australis TaxID=1399860 RepID=A0A2C5X7D9_9HYPO|nr:hypothetical protein CDD81_3134 [Ophiocordyceps australis]
MRLLMIRHGESVDNVAHLYAGSRDSPLTTHGALQADRLASSFARSVKLTYIYSSPLKRAAQTAQIIHDAQHPACLNVIRVEELREKHFGSAEGQSYRAKDPFLQNGPCLPEAAESNDSMNARMHSFFNRHLAPLLHRECESGQEMTCAIVSHGIILSVLYKVLSTKISRVTTPEVLSAKSDANVPPVCPSWSNTGFLDVTLSRSNPSSPLVLCISSVNCTLHLANLRKTRGGIGSAPLDQRQRTIRHFFTPKSRQDATFEKDGTSNHV